LELNQSQLALVNKEKVLQHLDFLRTQSDLENERLVKQQKEKAIQLQSTRVKSLTQQNEIIQLNQQKLWIYIIIGFILLGAVSMYFIYRSRLRGVRLETQLVKEKALQEKKESEFQHKLADISMSALRSQMNPHFIFNCMNIIDSLISDNRREEAQEFLQKYSKLIRLVLENSQHKLVLLKHDIMAVELYIELEAIRSNHKFSYNIEVDNELLESEYRIPPLLLQPYIENAIVHGLRNKEQGKGNLIVFMKKTMDQIEIIIEDNGIGREKALKLKKENRMPQEQFGMKATSRRISLLRLENPNKVAVEITDVFEREETCTKVRIVLPEIFNF
jgi:LytS/YehU family sensor histidine kinase